ncbi:MAG: hypothetical protein ACXQTI_04470, partial [Candidatus Nezhaarchaeales archaeon]
LRSSEAFHVVDIDEGAELSDNIVVLRPLTLVARDIDLEVVIRDVSRAFDASAQLGVLKSLYYFYHIHYRGARPKELSDFINRLGVRVKSNVVRSKLLYLHRKYLVLKKGYRYLPRRDLDLDDLEKFVDLSRARAGRCRWSAFASHPKKDWRPRYAEDANALLKEFNVEKLKKHILRCIEEGRHERALARLLFYGGGLRSSDRVIELRYDEGFHAIVYEAKVKRLRLVHEEHDRLWHELLRDDEIRRWLLEAIMRHDEGQPQHLWRQEHRWRLSDDDWMRISLFLNRKEKRLGRRVYLAYQHLGGQAYTLSVRNGEALVIGVHVDLANDDYYVTRL